MRECMRIKKRQRMPSTKNKKGQECQSDNLIRPHSTVCPNSDMSNELSASECIPQFCCVPCGRCIACFFSFCKSCFSSGRLQADSSHGRSTGQCATSHGRLHAMVIFRCCYFRWKGYCGGGCTVSEHAMRAWSSGWPCGASHRHWLCGVLSLALHRLPSYSAVSTVRPTVLDTHTHTCGGNSCRLQCNSLSSLVLRAVAHALRSALFVVCVCQCSVFGAFVEHLLQSHSDTVPLHTALRSARSDPSTH